MYALKFILLLAIFCTSTIIGMLISRKYSNRVNILNNLKNALNIFEVKINFSVETIPEIFIEISKKISGTAGKIFKDTVTYINKENMLAGDAWENSIENNKESLKKEDIACLKTLGKLLGKTDVDGQVNQIQLVKQFLEKQINDADTERNRNEKMYKKLGAIVGLIIVIVLI